MKKLVIGCAVAVVVLFAPLPGQPATPNDGVIDGTYQSSIDLFGVTAGLRF
jgi:hypothetical protein